VGSFVAVAGGSAGAVVTWRVVSSVVLVGGSVVNVFTVVVVVGRMISFVAVVGGSVGAVGIGRVVSSVVGVGGSTVDVVTLAVVVGPGK
jgi:hypothetical protein